MKAVLATLALLLSATLPVHAEQFGLFTYEVSDGEITITDYPEDATSHVEIPAEIEGLTVVSIGSGAFSDCTGLTSLSIPDSVTEIYWYAFIGCTGLTAISVDPLNSNYSSLDGVLFNKDRTTLIQYPAWKSGTYDIPDGVTYIDEVAYFGCTGLTSLAISDSVTGIGRSSFSGCTGLTSLSVPHSVTGIDDSAFRGCTGLTEITIPEGVTLIGEWAFYGCTGLTFVSIPSIATTILRDAFSGCTSLAQVTFAEGLRDCRNIMVCRAGPVKGVG